MTAAKTPWRARHALVPALATAGLAFLADATTAQTIDPVGSAPTPLQVAAAPASGVPPVGQPGATPTAIAPRSLKCPHPADPHRRHFECKTEPFSSLEETLTGDWNQARDEMKRLGITPTASYAGAWFGAASGPGTKPTFAGQFNGALNVELDKAIGTWSGLSFYVSGIAAQQTNVNSYLNTNLFAVNGLAAGNTGWLGEMYVQQTALGGALTVAAGWLGPAVTFDSLPVLANYLSTAYVGNPTAPAANDPAFGGPPPNSQWGVQAIYNLTPVWQLAGGVFNNNPNAAAGAKHGTNFRMRQGNTGALWVGQVNYLYNQGPSDKGLPGQYTLGGFYDSNAFQNLATGANVDGNWNLYLLGQQQVTRDGGAGSARGLTLWGSVNYASKQSVNILPVELGLGASYQGPFPSRPNDIASAGWFYGKVSDTQAPATATQAMELNYQWVVNGAITLIGDFQYLWRLNGLPSPGAAVFGIQASVTF